jgi:hypothetical protein
MPSPHANKIMGERLVDGLRIKFTATLDHDVWTVDVLDHHGGFTRDFSNNLDPVNVWGVIAELLDEAEHASRAALREMAEVE